MPKQFILPATFMICAFLLACSGNTSSKQSGNTDTTHQSPQKPDTSLQTPTLTCNDLGFDSLDIPHAQLFLAANGQQVLIDTIYTCGEIAKSEYKDFEIPADALIARGGWWAGGGEYYYLVIRDGKPVIYAGWQDEGQTDNGYHWEIKKIKEP